mmetsp:Transcript_31536/g.94852  ORF Transcript_31536/g.94852 Transcript_31536/m.94852 type:complete len:274 (+) Transcript_31536:68-889(+)
MVSLGQWDQGKGPKDEVLRQIVHVGPTWAYGRQVHQVYKRCLYELAVSKNGEGCGLPQALVAKTVPVLDKLVATQRDLPVVGDGPAVDSREHVASPEGRAHGWCHAREQHPRDAVWHAVRGPKGLVLELVPAVGDGGRQRIALVRLATLEECPDNLGGNDITDVVRDAAHVLAEGNACDLAAGIEDRAATVPRVDGCVDLDHHCRVCRRRELNGIHAGDDPLRDTDGAAAGGEAKGTHGLLQRRQAIAKRHWHIIANGSPEVVRHRSLDLDQG